VAESILVVVLLIALGLFLGEVFYRSRDDTARLWGNISQAVYALFGIIIVAALAFSGTVYAVISMVFIVFYWALLRARSADVRRKLNG
jgi:hypothetical protein